MALDAEPTPCVAKSSIAFNVGSVSACSLNPFFLLLFFFFFRLPQCFRFREEAQKYYSPILVGLFRKQIVKVLDVALSNEFFDHGLHSNEAPPRLLLQT